MRLINITLAKAVEGLRDVVARFGEDHANGSSCRYAEYEGSRLVPVCLVGQFIADLGFLGALVSNDSMTWDDTIPKQAATCSPNSEFTAYLAEHGVTFDDDAVWFLQVAQQEQDASVPWGLAVKNALGRVHDEAVAALPTFSLLGYSEND